MVLHSLELVGELYDPAVLVTATKPHSSWYPLNYLDSSLTCIVRRWAYMPSLQQRVAMLPWSHLLRCETQLDRLYGHPCEIRAEQGMARVKVSHTIT